MSLHNKHLFISFSFSILSMYTRRSPGRDFSGKKEENTYICTHISAPGKKKNRRYRSQFNKANNNSHNDAINASVRARARMDVAKMH